MYVHGITEPSFFVSIIGILRLSFVILLKQCTNIYLFVLQFQLRPSNAHFLVIFDTSGVPKQTRGKSDKFKPLQSYSRLDLYSYVSGPIQRVKRVSAPNGNFIGVTFCITTTKKSGVEGAIQELVNAVGPVVGDHGFSKSFGEAQGSNFYVHHSLKGPRADSTSLPHLSYHHVTLFLKADQFEPR